MSTMADPHSSLETSLAGVRLSGPIISAAGTGGTATELADVLDLADLGAVTTKSITPEPRAGNAAMRVADVPAGMLNAVGLMNMGVEAFIEGTVSALSGCNTTFIGSVAGHCVEDYVQVAAAFDPVETLPLIELNLSCPNSSTGRRFTDGPAELAEVVGEVRAAVTNSRLLVKLPLLFETAVPMAAAAIEAGADGLTMINTIPALSIDVDEPHVTTGVRARWTQWTGRAPAGGLDGAARACGRRPRCGHPDHRPRRRATLGAGCGLHPCRGHRGGHRHHALSRSRGTTPDQPRACPLGS